MKYIDNKIVYEVGDWVITRGYHINWDNKALKINRINGSYKDPHNCFCYFMENNPWNFAYSDIKRFATQEEIDEALKEDKIMVGEHEVKVGYQTVSKDLFLKIGKKAGWI